MGTPLAAGTLQVNPFMQDPCPQSNAGRAECHTRI